MRFYLLALFLTFLSGVILYLYLSLQTVTNDVALLKNELARIENNSTRSLERLTNFDAELNDKVLTVPYKESHEKSAPDEDLRTISEEHQSKIKQLLARASSTSVQSADSHEQSFVEEGENANSNDALSREHSIQRIFVDEQSSLKALDVHCKTSTCKIVYETDNDTQGSSGLEEMEFLASLTKISGGSLDVKYGSTGKNRTTLYVRIPETDSAY